MKVAASNDGLPEKPGELMRVLTQAYEPYCAPGEPSESWLKELARDIKKAGEQ